MNSEISNFLKDTPLFSSLSDEETEYVVPFLKKENYSRNSIIFLRGKSVVENLYIVAKGAVELFCKEAGRKIYHMSLNKGDVFGGIPILMTGGISTLSARAIQDSEIYTLERKVFLETCIRNKSFYNFFENAHAEQLEDPVYSSLLQTCEAFRFLKSGLPFSLLPDEAIENAASKMSNVKYPEGAILFVQDRTKVENLYIICKGAAERYYEESDRKIRGALSGEGTVYGGISMLLNDGVAVRTLRINEDSEFYVLPKKDFLDLCDRHPAFVGYFTEAFGKRMMDKAYAELIGKSMDPRQEAIQAFNQPISGLLKEKPFFCDENHSIRQVAAMMKDHGAGAVFVRDKNGEYVGMVTESDLARKVVAENMDTNLPVFRVMSAPIQTISDQALFYEAHLSMIGKDIRHLAAEDSRGRIVGVISRRDLLLAQAQSPSFAIFEIGTAKRVEDVFPMHRKLPGIVDNLLKSGATVKNITRYITTFSDAILNKLIDFATGEMGPPPARFAFMIMGSEGRREQTLKTDQDNAMVYEDMQDDGEDERARDYFSRFGRKICAWLDKSGYAFCEGEIMAQNPRWTQPLSQWKNYFSSWIFKAEGKDLLEASIFFDFRGAYGDMELVRSLRKYLADSLMGWAGFFRHLTENAMYYKPPLGFFGNIITETKDGRRDVFDIKAAMMPVIDYARIYALKHDIDETNTQERLFRLHVEKVLSWTEYSELDQAYSFMMQLRFRHQTRSIVEENRPPDNFVNLKKLTRIEQTMLKEIFKRLDKFQSKLNIDFTGLV